MECAVSTMGVSEINYFSVDELNFIRETIENMNKFNQLEVLKMLSRHHEVTLNENNYGVHINLSEVKTEWKISFL